PLVHGEALPVEEVGEDGAHRRAPALGDVEMRQVDAVGFEGLAPVGGEVVADAAPQPGSDAEAGGVARDVAGGAAPHGAAVEDGDALAGLWELLDVELQVDVGVAADGEERSWHQLPPLTTNSTKSTNPSFVAFV